MYVPPRSEQLSKEAGSDLEVHGTLSDVFVIDLCQVLVFTALA